MVQGQRLCAKLLGPSTRTSTRPDTDASSSPTAMRLTRPVLWWSLSTFDRSLWRERGIDCNVQLYDQDVCQGSGFETTSSRVDITDRRTLCHLSAPTSQFSVRHGLQDIIAAHPEPMKGQEVSYFPEVRHEI